MRYRMHTASGAVYLIDDTAMTWERARPVETEMPILGLNRDAGKLTEIPQPRLGTRCRLDIEYPEDPQRPENYITTTAVQLLQLTDL